MRVRPLVVGSLFVLVAACGSSNNRSGFDEGTPPAGSAQPPAPNLGMNQAEQLVDVTIAGKVFAPNGTLPLANTLVYVSANKPDAIPAGAYCDECVTLTDGTFAVSGADGTFSFDTKWATGKSWLVVQKGQFRRTTQIQIDGPGAVKLDNKWTTLPGKGDAANGDDVPKMVVLKDDSDFDHIYESLNKLGITDFEIRTDRTLLENQAELMKYHVVFVPCGGQADPEVTSAQAKANMQAFVQAGGKLYVTDWSYEFVRQPFTGYVSWVGETATIGSAASGDEWDSPATAEDQGLNDWLAATGDASFSVTGNWTEIAGVNTMPGTDAKGNPVDVTPTVWITGKKNNVVRPTTVSFQQQCGRVLFSTYHTESGFGGNPDLLAQEKALLYVLLEVSVCIGQQGGTTH